MASSSKNDLLTQKEASGTMLSMAGQRHSGGLKTTSKQYRCELLAEAFRHPKGSKAERQALALYAKALDEKSPAK